MSRNKFPPRKRHDPDAGPVYLYGLHTVRAALDNPRREKRRLLVTTNARGRLAELFRALRRGGKPTVARVNGHALAGGFEAVLACDLVVAGDQATLALPEVGVGVIPGGGGTQLLTRRVGWSRAASVIFTARRMSGAEAHELGVVDELVAAGSARERALAIATQIAANSPVAVRNAKQAMRLGMGTDLAAGLEIEDGAWRATAFSGDRKEGVSAFAEKRTPEWPGR